MTAGTFFRTQDDAAYRRWIADYEELSDAERLELSRAVDSLAFKPKILVAPVVARDADATAWKAFAQRLETHLYPNFEALPPGPGPDVVAAAAAHADFVLPLPLDAALHPHALARFALALAEAPDADILYADEDVLRDGKRSKPQFKTDFDPYLLLGKNSIGLPALYRAKLLRRLREWSLSSLTVDNFLHALALAASRETASDKIRHIPAVLGHRSGEGDWSGAEAARIVHEHLVAGADPVLDLTPAPLAPRFNRIRFPLPTPAPLVSILIPTKDRADLLGPCIDGLLRDTDYPSLELVVVDNGTSSADALAILEALPQRARAQILRDEGPFNFSRLNNTAAKAATGDLLLLLNNDTKVLHADWLQELVSLASRPDVGVAGAKLLYPDFRVQHAGMVFGNDAGVYHQMRLAPREEPGPGGELALLRGAWAVTGACLAVRKALYFEVGGLDEDDLQVSCSDMDLCRKIAEKGLAILWTPFSELLHFESPSRGLATGPATAEREDHEAMRFWARRPQRYETPDPYYNPQIEHKPGYVDFARPPRPHPFGAPIRAKVDAPAYY